MLSKPITDLSGSAAQEFTIANILSGPANLTSTYRALNLEYLNFEKSELTDITFLRPQQLLTISVG